MDRKNDGSARRSNSRGQPDDEQRIRALEQGLRNLHRLDREGRLLHQRHRPPATEVARNTLPVAAGIDHPAPTQALDPTARPTPRPLQTDSATRHCGMCSERKAIDQFPIRTHAGAGQAEFETCRECWSRYIDSALSSLPTDQIECPFCAVTLSRAIVQSVATADVYLRYSDQATHELLRRQPGYFECLAAGCKSGQILGAGNVAIYRCAKCSQLSCIPCQAPSHIGETCTAYQARMRAEMARDQATERLLASETKPCPGCGARIEKIASGCDHMTLETRVQT
ncbi:hypothetical protein LTR65_009218 [Meristemomyces frigidus]